MQRLKVNFTPFNSNEISENIVRIDNEKGAHDFAFDTTPGKFISNIFPFDQYDNHIETKGYGR